MSEAVAVPSNSNTGGYDIDIENQSPNTLGPDQTYTWLAVANAHARPLGREQSAVVTKFKQAVQLKVHGQYRLSKAHREVLAEARQQQQEKLRSKQSQALERAPRVFGVHKPKMSMEDICTSILKHAMKVTPDLITTSGYTASGLCKIKAKLQQGWVPSTKRGRRPNVQTSTVLAYQALTDRNAIPATEFDAGYDELHTIEHMAGPNAHKPLVLSSRTTKWRYNKMGKMANKAAQNQTLQRKEASEDLWNQILLFVFFQAIQKVYSAPDQPFDFRLLLNIDASTLKTLDVSNLIKARKGSQPLKLLTKKAQLRQQIGLIMGYSASGVTLTPMLWIKARKGVQIEKPVILQLTDSRITDQFLGRHVPVYVIMYHAQDKVTKGALVQMYMDLVVVPSTEDLRTRLKPGTYPQTHRHASTHTYT